MNQSQLMYKQGWSRLRLMAKHEQHADEWASFYRAYNRKVHEAIMDTWYNKSTKFNGWHNQSRRWIWLDHQFPF